MIPTFLANFPNDLVLLMPCQHANGACCLNNNTKLLLFPVKVSV